MKNLNIKHIIKRFNSWIDSLEELKELNLLKKELKYLNDELRKIKGNIIPKETINKIEDMYEWYAVSYFVSNNNAIKEKNLNDINIKLLNSWDRNEKGKRFVPFIKLSQKDKHGTEVLYIDIPKIPNIIKTLKEFYECYEKYFNRKRIKIITPEYTQDLKYLLEE